MYCTAYMLECIALNFPVVAFFVDASPQRAHATIFQIFLRCFMIDFIFPGFFGSDL